MAERGLEQVGALMVLLLLLRWFLVLGALLARARHRGCWRYRRLVGCQAWRVAMRSLTW